MPGSSEESRVSHALEKAGKSVRMEIYEHGCHDFCLSQTSTAD